MICQSRGQLVDTFGNSREALWTVVRGIHPRNNCEKHLSRANITGCLLPPNVLFAGLKCQPVGGRAISINADPYQTARQAAF